MGWCPEHHVPGPSPTEKFLAAAMAVTEDAPPPRQDAEGHAFEYVDAIITRPATGMEMAVELQDTKTAVLTVATVWPVSEGHGVVKATDVLARINGVPLTDLLREVGLELPVDFPLVKRYVRARPRPVTLTFRTRAGRDFVQSYQDSIHDRIKRVVRRWRSKVAARKADDVPPLVDSTAHDDDARSAASDESWGTEGSEAEAQPRRKKRGSKRHVCPTTMPPPRTSPHKKRPSVKAAATAKAEREAAADAERRRRAAEAKEDERQR